MNWELFVLIVYFVAMLGIGIWFFIRSKSESEKDYFLGGKSMGPWVTAMRSPYYAVAYTANDIVLIVLWITATVQDIAYLPMIFCFVMFMANDLYGFWHWCRMRDRQERE